MDNELEATRLRGVAEGMRKAADLIDAEWAGLSRFKGFVDVESARKEADELEK